MTTSDFGADVFDDGDPLDDQPAATPARARRTRKRKTPEDRDTPAKTGADDSSDAEISSADPQSTGRDPGDADSQASSRGGASRRAAPSGDAEASDGDEAAPKPARRKKSGKKKATSRRKSTPTATDASAEDADPAPTSTDVDAIADPVPMSGPDSPIEEARDETPTVDSEHGDAEGGDPEGSEADDSGEHRRSRERRRRRRGPKGRSADSETDPDAVTNSDASSDDATVTQRSDPGAGDASEQEAADEYPESDGSDADDRRENRGADADPDHGESDPESRRRGDGDRDRDEDGDHGSRRGRRRRRRRHGAEGDFEDDGGEGATPHARPSRDHARRVAFRAPASDAGRQGQRVAVFVDLEGLDAHPKDLDGTIRDDDDARPALAFGRLLTELTGRRHLIRAFAYGDASSAATLDGNGFEHRAVADRLTRVVAVTVDAMQAAPRVDTMVFLGVGLAGGEAALAPLYRALEAQGIRLETAGFGDDHVDAARIPASHHHVLGEECTLRP